MEPYDQETERTMKRFYDTLSEKDRRRYAGVAALKYGQGGRSYIARVLGCSRRTVSKGAKEVSQLSGGDVDRRIRHRGGLDANGIRNTGLTLTRNFCKCCGIIRLAIPWMKPCVGPT